MSQPITISHFRGKNLLKTNHFLLRASATPFSLVTNLVPLKNEMHPLHRRAQLRHQSRLEQLNIYAIVNLSTHKSACVRDRIRRRLREATRLCLVDRGFKIDGSLIVGKSQAPGLVAHGPKQKLTGTLCYFPEYNVVGLDWDTLMEEVRNGVNKFFELKRLDVQEKERAAEYKSRELDHTEKISQRHRSPYYSKEPSTWKSKLPVSMRNSATRDNPNPQVRRSNIIKKMEGQGNWNSYSRGGLI